MTLLLEGAVVLPAYRRQATLGQRAAVALAANLATHGLLWVAWPHLPGPYLPRLAVAEGVVVLVEAGLYAALLGGGARRAVLTSLAANALSTGAGLALWRLWP